MELSLEELIEKADKIREYQRRMYHKYSPIYYNNRALMLHRLGVQNMLFEDIIVEGEENVRKVQDKQLVYVSNHVSMADYLVQGYIFWRDKLPIPRFLAGENLNIKFMELGKFFRKCGAIFIDRNEKSKFYWRFEDMYIKEVAGKESLWFCPEGTRTESLSEFKTGTFSQLIYVSKEGCDAWIVPVYNRYDKRPEEWKEGYMDKIRENKKKGCKLLRKAKGLRYEGKNFTAKIFEFRAKIRNKIYLGLDIAAYVVRPFVKDKGNAYVYFGEAFHIKDYSDKFELAERAKSEIEKLEKVYKSRNK